jgi:PAS domain S-box-containing protein
MTRVMTGSNQSSGNRASPRALRLALVAGVVANVLLAGMLFVHVFIHEPAYEIPLHVKLLIVSVLSLTISMLVAVLAWQYLRKAEAARREHEGERLFRVRADDSPLMLWMTDIDSKCIFANKAWQRFVGLPIEAIIGDGWANPIHPDDRERAYEDFQQRTAKREPVSIEYRVRRADGQYRWILDAGYPRFNETTGEYEGYSGGCTDVTERRTAMEELRQWSAAMEAAMDGIARLDAHGRYEFVSQQYARLVGRPLPELLGAVWDITVYPDDLPMLREAYSEMLHVGRVEVEARGLRKDGVVFHKRVAMVARRDDAGALLGHYCFMKDISQEQEREQRARATSRKLEALTVSAPVAIFHMLPDGACTYVNPEWGAITGFALGDALGMGWVNAVHPDDRGLVQSRWNAAVAAQRDFEIAARVVRPDGQMRWVIARATMVRDALGKPEYIGTLVDFTSVKAAELSLRESLKVQEQLLVREAGLRRELDHRVRNNLAGLLGLLQVYRLRGLPDAQLIDVIEGKILVLKEIHELLAGGAGQPVVLADVIARLVTRLAPAGRTSHIRFAGPRVTLASTQAGAMAMIVQELLTNSAKHGALSVDEGHIAVTWSLSGEASDRLFLDWVEMPLLSPPRITDEHASMRETGIGLSIVQGLAHAELRGDCTYGPRLDGVDKAWVVSLQAQLEQIDVERAIWQETSTVRGGV